MIQFKLSSEDPQISFLVMHMLKKTCIKQDDCKKQINEGELGLSLEMLFCTMSADQITSKNSLVFQRQLKKAVDSLEYVSLSQWDFVPFLSSSAKKQNKNSSNLNTEEQTRKGACSCSNNKFLLPGFSGLDNRKMTVKYIQRAPIGSNGQCSNDNAKGLRI
uniref:Uncharacterized protein n=1 Tax=Sphaerodactylus townsendi TaxID=933632 RepID=A0ACB8FQM4_9SAUR